MANAINPLTITRRALDVALVALVALGLATTVIARLVPLTGHQTLVVAGSSMEPTIPLGAAVLTEPVAPAELRVGDVVSLATGPSLETVFTHRITRLISRPDGLWIETKGDANETVDPVITPVAHILGRVIVEVPGAGYLLRFLSLPSGLAASICLVALLVILSWFLDSLARDRKVRVAASMADLRGTADDGASDALTSTPSRRPSTPRTRGRSRDRIRHAIAPRSAAAIHLSAQ